MSEQARPMGIGSRGAVRHVVRGLYQRRRREVLDSAAEGLRASGLPVSIDVDARLLQTRVDSFDARIEFRTRRQLLGAHISAVYGARIPARRSGDGALGYQWGLARRRGFVARRGSSQEVRAFAERLNCDERLEELLVEHDIRAIGIASRPDGWEVALQPVAGVITVVYMPPMPPFTMRFKAAEVAGHVEILRRVAALARER